MVYSVTLKYLINYNYSHSIFVLDFVNTSSVQYTLTRSNMPLMEYANLNT